MSSTWGDKIKISIFGESHGRGIGVVINGLKAGFKIDFDKLDEFTSRRRPGSSEFVTARNESDKFNVLSGISNGFTTGAPIAAITENCDVKSGAYKNVQTLARPSHADYPAYVKYGGFCDLNGGGHFSARLTAPLVFAGGIAEQYLESMGVKIFSHIYSIKDVFDTPFNLTDTEKYYEILSKKDFKVLNDLSEEKMKETIRFAKSNCDSVGGVIECAATGLKVGAGDPIFGGLESKISSIVFGIPAVKGIEFGAGFKITEMYGSEANDCYFNDNGNVRLKTNNNGGILGGLSDGMPIVFKVAFKPTPSISKEQNTINYKTLKEETLQIKGRHDPCVALRGGVCVEAALALALLDSLYE